MGDIACVLRKKSPDWSVETVMFFCLNSGSSATFGFASAPQTSREASLAIRDNGFIAVPNIPDMYILMLK